MRIVIEGDKGIVVQTDRGPTGDLNVIDAGPPPTALLRRFGREPSQVMTQIEGGAAPSKRSARKIAEKPPLNQLRAGEAIARARYGPKPQPSGKKASADRGAPKRSPRKPSRPKRKE